MSQHYLTKSLLRPDPYEVSKRWKGWVGVNSAVSVSAAQELFKHSRNPVTHRQGMTLDRCLARPLFEDQPCGQLMRLPLVQVPHEAMSPALGVNTDIIQYQFHRFNSKPFYS
jgi:hypothetical protein